MANTVDIAALSRLKIFPLHNFQRRDCPCILVHTFGIGLLLLMSHSEIFFCPLLPVPLQLVCHDLGKQIPLEVQNIP